MSAEYPVSAETVERAKHAIDNHILYGRECGCGVACQTEDDYSRHLARATVQAVADEIGSDDTTKMILDELKAIRVLLEQQGICPHGSTGLCMFCIQPTLDSIEMAVRQAVTR